MTATFELWDAESGNAVGSFSNLDEALVVVAALLDSFGQEYARDLVLLRRLEEGTASLEARGGALIGLVGRHRASPTVPLAVAPSG